MSEFDTLGIDLKNGGSVLLTLEASIFTLEPAEREFIFSLVDRFREFREAASPRLITHSERIPEERSPSRRPRKQKALPPAKVEAPAKSDGRGKSAYAGLTCATCGGPRKPYCRKCRAEELERKYPRQTQSQNGAAAKAKPDDDEARPTEASEYETAGVSEPEVPPLRAKHVAAEGGYIPHPAWIKDHSLCRKCGGPKSIEGPICKTCFKGKPL